MIDIKIKTTEVFDRLNIMVPYYSTDGSAGADVCACIEDVEWFDPGEVKLISLGFSMEIPEGYEAQLRMRSGISLKKGLTLANGVGTIDSDFRGVCQAIMVNVSNKRCYIEPRERIAQLVFMPVIQVNFEKQEELSDTMRGSGGFGSTGDK